MDKHKIIVEKYKKQISKALGFIDWDIIQNEYKTSFSEKFVAGKYDLIRGKTIVSSFELVPMINCCGIIVSTRVVVTEDFRNRGLGTILNSLRIDIARNLGYGLLLCTDVVDNIPQQRILIANGWKSIEEFINPRTKNRVAIHTIKL